MVHFSFLKDLTRGRLGDGDVEHPRRDGVLGECEAIGFFDIHTILDQDYGGGLRQGGRRQPRKRGLSASEGVGMGLCRVQDVVIDGGVLDFVQGGINLCGSEGMVAPEGAAQGKPHGGDCGIIAATDKCGVDFCKW